jgi:hypothetical protein
MKTTKNIEKFASLFSAYYEYLYEYDMVETELNLAGLGFSFANGRFKQLAADLMKHNQDIFTSDREHSAFALAILHSYHISPINIFKK